MVDGDEEVDVLRADVPMILERTAIVGVEGTIVRDWAEFGSLVVVMLLEMLAWVTANWALLLKAYFPLAHLES